jgi:thiol:disulfide interchange protein DsbD
MKIPCRSTVLAALVAGFLTGAVSFASAQGDAIKWSAATKATSVKPGATFEVQVTADLAEGWHLYSITQAPPPIATRITVPGGQPFALAGSVEGPTPRVAFDQSFGIDTEFYEDNAAFVVPVKAAADAPGGKRKLRIDTYFQLCNDQLCLPPKTVPVEVELTIAGAPVAAAPAASTATTPVGGVQGPAGSTTTASPAAPGVTPPAALASQTASPASGSPASASGSTAVPPASSAAAGQTGGIDRGGSLWAFVWLAMTMGALSLLTPCVFPMVPITVSFFTKRADGGRGKAVGQAATYVAGIVFTFTVLGMAMALLVGATGLSRFAASPWVNLLITGIFVAFALSLFGVFDFGLPPALVNKLDSLTRKQGGNQTLATLLMGLTFTLTTFSCTAPFIGTLLVMAAGGDWMWPLVGMVAYSTVFAAPFFVLALMPQLVASLPKSGGWMSSVKVLMGFLVIAAAMKFVANVDKVWGWGIFTHDVVLASWVVLFVLMAIYVLGLFRFAHEAPIKHVGITRLATSIVCGVIGLWLMTGLHGKPLGELDAFLPMPDSPKTGAATAGASNELPWITNDYQQALAVAKRDGKRVFVDFTGYTCTNCRWMEVNMMPRPEVREQLAKYVLVKLYTDREGEPYQTQQLLQQEKYKTVALPFYAIENPDGSPVASFPGLTRDASQFVGFLAKGQN